MKRHLLIIALLTVLIGCGKETDLTLRYPKTELAGTTWKRFSHKATLSQTDVYQYLEFSKSMTVDIYDETIWGSDNKQTMPYTLKLSDKNMDSFEVKYPDGTYGAGFTTSDTDKIQYNGKEFTRTE